MSNHPTEIKRFVYSYGGDLRLKSDFRYFYISFFSQFSLSFSFIIVLGFSGSKRAKLLEKFQVVLVFKTFNEGVLFFLNYLNVM